MYYIVFDIFTIYKHQLHNASSLTNNTYAINGYLVIKQMIMMVISIPKKTYIIIWEPKTKSYCMSLIRILFLMNRFNIRNKQNASDPSIKKIKLLSQYKIYIWHTYSLPFRCLLENIFSLLSCFGFWYKT